MTYLAAEVAVVLIGYWVFRLPERGRPCEFYEFTP